MSTVNQALAKLSQSKFRSSFHLNKDDIKYINNKGPEVIRSHAVDFVNQKLRPANPVNDGKQTPMRGHPVFKAMHATACCCRGCLYKWYRVPKGVELTDLQCQKIVNLLLCWIENQKDNYKQ